MHAPFPRLRSRLLLLPLLLACLGAPLRAEEPAPPPDPEVVGRQLLALDAEDRARGEAALLDAVQRVTDPRGFVRRMAAALREWADAEERLVETWIERALHGDSEEQARATLMLTALGEPAVSRLMTELRRAHGSPSGGRLAPPAEPGAEPPASDPLPAPLGRAQIYDVADLLGAGSRELELVSLAKRSADSPQVALINARLVVTANDAGHARLALALGRLRPDASVTAPAAAQGPAPAATSAAPTAPAAEEALVAGADPAQVRATPPEGPPQWALKLWAISMAEREIEGLLPRTGAGTPQDSTRGSDGALTAVGPPEWAASWAQRALRSADAEALGEKTLDLWDRRRAAAHLGRVVTYRREARPGAGGAWAVVTAALKTGLEIAATSEEGALALEIVWGTVTLPLPTSSVVPGPGVAPVELDRPDWTAARRRVRLAAPPRGTAALLALPGLLPGSDRRLVVVLALEPR